MGKSDKCMTGYYGRPGTFGGKVHIIEDGKPICNTHIHDKAEFQYCSYSNNIKYTSCIRCLKLMED